MEHNVLVHFPRVSCLLFFLINIFNLTTCYIFYSVNFICWKWSRSRIDKTNPNTLSRFAHTLWHFIHLLVSLVVCMYANYFHELFLWYICSCRFLVVRLDFWFTHCDFLYVVRQDTQLRCASDHCVIIKNNHHSVTMVTKNASRCICVCSFEFERCW